jgi:hypothetical protein
MIVNALQEHRQLGGELGRLLHRQAVAERLQHGPHDPEGPLLIVQAHLLLEVAEPLARGLQ